MVTAPEIDAVLSTSRLEDIDTLLEKVQNRIEKFSSSARNIQNSYFLGWQSIQTRYT